MKEKMKLVFPCVYHQEKARDFIEEFYKFKSEIHGSGGLDRFLEESTYEQYLKKVIADMDIANISEGRVPALTYFYMSESGEIVGMINIRLALNDFLRREGGHIGYCIRPSQRKKGYGSDMLKQALVACKVIGLDEIIVTCDKSNLASAGVIKNCGGVLDEEFYSDTYKEIVQRYIIKLN